MFEDKNNEELSLTEYEAKEKEPIIMVMGVGGGGGNIVSEMHRKSDFERVSFVLCNTDSQDLYDKHSADKKIILGASGLGAGGDSRDGKTYAEYNESSEQIKECLSNESLEMLFIVATLGGGTGTGAAPVIARIAKEIEKRRKDKEEVDHLLVVGVVTLPDGKSEGEGSVDIAIDGLELLMKHTDSVIVIRNEGALKAAGPDATISEANEILNSIPIQAVKAISWIITETMEKNVDFNDVKNILKDGETAIITIGYGSGEDRMKKAIDNATKSHYLNNKDLYKAKRLMYCLFDNSAKYSGDSEELRIKRKKVEINLKERDIIIPEYFLKPFKNIEFDPENKKKRLILGYDRKFPNFELDNLLDENGNELEDTVGVIILATGFMFQKDDFYFDPEEDEAEVENIETNSEALKEGFYDNNKKNKLQVDPKAKGYILNPNLWDNDTCINFLENKSPSLRLEEDQEKYKELIAHAKKQQG